MFDSAGVLIISVLIALFGFLTSRAWKLKTAILKWVAGSSPGWVLQTTERFDKPIVNTQVTVTLRSMLHILLF
jgi:hypothetical protein